MARYRQEQEEFGRWTRWVRPKRSLYKLACCDCGLVHDMQFRLVPSANGGRHIEMRASRNNRATGQVRRHMAKE